MTKINKFRQIIRLGVFLNQDQSKILIVHKTQKEIKKQSHLQHKKKEIQILNLNRIICLKIKKFMSFDPSNILHLNVCNN